MHKPLDSVVALARFSLSDSQLDHARYLLAEETDWQKWIEHVELHGLSGFANKHILERQLPVPKATAVSLRALVVRHKAAAQARFQSLQKIDQVLNDREIPYLALKGTALMPHVYAEYGGDHIRPMRDMDLLLPKGVAHQAADCLREIGFDLPHTQPSRYMRDMHQLPNATKKVNGFTISVELHRDGISREGPGHFYYPTSNSDLQTIQWHDLRFKALEDIQFAHQVTRHLQGLHNNAVLKLINVMDVIGLALKIEQSGHWPRLQQAYPHVINSLRCLHLLTPLPLELQARLAPMPVSTVNGVGQIMGSMRNALVQKRTLKERLQLLFRPSDWWLHLYYNIDPDKSLFWVKLFKHPLRIMNWLSRRLYSGLLGG